MKNRKIGWQKYEDVIHTEMYSPLVSLVVNELNPPNQEGFEETPEIQEEAMVIPENFYGTVSLMSRFDCWVGHTNFNINEGIKNTLNQVDGVEVLDIISRYRFFIGIGKMFKFSDVRKDIERAVCSQGEKIGEESITRFKKDDGR